jgi:hypothetical protein
MAHRRPSNRAASPKAHGMNEAHTESISCSSVSSVSSTTGTRFHVTAILPATSSNLETPHVRGALHVCAKKRWTITVTYPRKHAIANHSQSAQPRDQVQPFHKAVSIAGSSLATANLILRLHRRHLSLGHRVTDWSLCSQATRTRRARLL